MKISRKYIQRTTGISLVVAGFVALSSCGGDGALSGASGSANASLAGAAVGLFLGGGSGINLNQKPNAAVSLGGLQLQGFNSGSSLSVSADDELSDCIKITPDPLVDGDNDGIAKLKTYTYDCTDRTLQDGFTVNYKGSVNVQDLDDTRQWVAGGYRFDIDYSGKTSLPPTHNFTYSHKGFFESKRLGSSYVFTSQFQAGFAGQEHGQDFDFMWRSNYSTQFIPDDVNNPFITGKATFSGFIGVEGNLIPDQLEKFEVAFELSSSELVYDNSCAIFYKSGSMFWTDGAGQKFEIRYNCTSFDTFFQGQPVTAP